MTCGEIKNTVHKYRIFDRKGGSAPEDDVGDDTGIIKHRRKGKRRTVGWSRSDRE